MTDRIYHDRTLVIIGIIVTSLHFFHGDVFLEEKEGGVSTKFALVVDMSVVLHYHIEWWCSAMARIKIVWSRTMLTKNQYRMEASFD